MKRDRLTEVRYAACAKKRGYRTIPEARSAASYSWASTGVNLKVYMCRYCGKYHITHHLGKKGLHEAYYVAMPNYSGGWKTIPKDEPTATGGRKGSRKVARTDEEIKSLREANGEGFRKAKARHQRRNMVMRSIKWRDREEIDYFEDLRRVP